MLKQKNKYTPSKKEQVTLIVCLAIVTSFVLFVSIATRGSLAYYTALHALLALVILVVLLVRGLPQVVVRIALGLGVLGVVSAIALVMAYLPYYLSYLKYINSIQ